MVCVAVLASCYDGRPDDGQLLCASGPRPCPEGFHCAADDHCWLEGHEPDLSTEPGDGGGIDDLSAAVDGDAAAASSSVVLDVSAGGDFACAVVPTSSGDPYGNVYCWGTNDLGQLGVAPSATPATCVSPEASNPSIRCRTTAQPVAGVDHVVRVTTGPAHACALTDAGKVYCWGRSHQGELGYTTFSSSDLTTCGLALNERCNPKPTLVGLPFAVAVEVVATAHATCARSSTNDVSCWGVSDEGQLGNNTIGITRTAPGPVSSLGGLTKAAALGGCARPKTLDQWASLCAIDAGGGLYCWGDNFASGLGHDNTGDPYGSGTQYASRHVNPVPLPVAAADGSAGPLANVTSVAVLDAATCAVAGQALYCWGYPPVIAGAISSYVPQPISLGGASVAAVSGRGDNACALTTTGAVWCWGQDNDLGQLGNGVLGGASTRPTLVSGFTAQRLAVGHGFVLAIASDGTLWGWGDNYAGQTGHAPGAPDDVPCPPSIDFGGGTQPMCRTSPHAVTVLP